MDYTVVNTQKYVHDEFNAAQKPYYRLEGSGPMELCGVKHPRGEKIDLKARYRKGDKRTASITTDVTTDVQEGKEKQTNRLSMGEDVRMEVQSVDRSGTINWRIAVDRIRINSESDNAKVNFDTEHPDQNVEATARALKNTPTTLKMDKDYNLQFDAASWLAALKKAGADEAFATELTNGFAGAIKGDESVNFFAGVKARKPVGVGDQWHDKGSGEVSGVLTDRDITYTVQERHDGLVLIKFEGRIKAILKKQENLELTGPVRGTVEVSEKNGWINRIDILNTVMPKKTAEWRQFALG